VEKKEGAGGWKVSDDRTDEEGEGEREKGGWVETGGRAVKRGRERRGERKKEGRGIGRRGKGGNEEGE